MVTTLVTNRPQSLATVVSVPYDPRPSSFRKGKLSIMNISSTVVIRIAVAAMFIIHGVARFYYHQMSPFGAFLESHGLPFGLGWAWLVTLIEIIGGILLALGRYTAPLAAYFILETALGIWWIHWHS